MFVLSFLLPSVGFLGFVAILATILFAEFISIRDEYLKYGFYLYNSLLVGMGVGFYFNITLTTIFLTIILAILTFLFTFALNRIFLKYSLPVLSLPFALVGMLFYLASLKYNHLPSNTLDRVPLFDISVPFGAFFKSMGTIFFLPYNIAGVVIALVILLYSRILFFMAVMGFITGVFVHSFFVPFSVSLNSPYNFNFILIAMALGGFFFVANIKNYIIALLAVVISAIIIDSMEVFFTTYSLPVYTMPFNIVTILFLMLALGVGYKYYIFNPKSTPENSLSSYLSSLHRFGGSDIKINLPFIGEWSVYQAFNGKWTHKGAWRYAYDFVIQKDGKSYKDEGDFLEDYHAFGKDIISPVDGYVVALKSDLPDNFIGNVDRLNNWGNYIVIQSLSGHYIEISHLMQESLAVHIGEYVQLGQIIAKCGNSGYSPEPHIHIQVQKHATLGSETVPFKFIDYLKDGTLYYYALPEAGCTIGSLITDMSTQLHLTFILDDKFKYIDHNKKEYTIEVKMNEAGEFYFYDGISRLYFYLDRKLFYFYQFDGNDGYLKELFKIAPKIPLVNSVVEYKDLIPLEYRYSKVKSAFLQFLMTFNYKLFNGKTIYKKEGLQVNSKYGKLHFSFQKKGFELIKGRNFELKRVDEKHR